MKKLAMKVFATLSSEDPSVYNIQLTTWKISVDRWRDLKRECKDGYCDFNNLFEEACVILLLAGTSMSQLLGQNTSMKTDDVPGLNQLLNELVPDAKQRAVLKEFNEIYEDLRHFGESKHKNILGVDGTLFTKWMDAIQRIWIDIAKPPQSTVQEWFHEDFDLRLEVGN
ncbi:MAG: hypothetical protein IT445_04665 [Phycisphaeraceae bacterium]|nr:hypothetical protein [Phycisphaeraceae bacterium]